LSRCRCGFRFHVPRSEEHGEQEQHGEERLATGESAVGTKLQQSTLAALAGDASPAGDSRRTHALGSAEIRDLGFWTAGPAHGHLVAILQRPGVGQHRHLAEERGLGRHQTGGGGGHRHQKPGAQRPPTAASLPLHEGECSSVIPDEALMILDLGHDGGTLRNDDCQV
jgi:hypothetical protein